MSYRIVVILNLLCLSAISCSGEDENLNSILFSGDYEFIDLTHPFDNNTVYWPNTGNFVFTNKIAGEGRSGGWYAENSFSAGEHGGTHIDAPYHLNATGEKVGDISVAKLIVPMIIVDISSKVNDNPNFILYKHHLGNILNRSFEEPCMIIFRFGWSKYFNNRRKYLGITDDYRITLNFPGLSAEVAELIVSKKNIVAVGVDVVSIDPGRSSLRTRQIVVKKILADAGLYDIENVNLYRYIPERGCTAVALPMKIAKGSGAPMRLVAICPKQKPSIS